ncbi:carotenoid oxygenase family protein [Oceanicoccus sp. KOV_DT_Chl]|uniref:carotenoid oxygenase family protein n=1 Tax=Oceanicoccus sp. KOV_DT_Chl TaxID=1904639 RepID=UPI000C7C2584|nr:carotenoid oxygenase family protein [Oceanicoccus sp. KOV_DT_Chl]
MKRRDFLQYSGLGAMGVAATSVMTGCTKEEPITKFWQQGNFRPVSEEVTETKLVVEGAIPPELSGLYIRNGTNESTGIADHFFGGDGMVHGVRLENGEAKWYRNRYIDTPVYRKEKTGFGAPKPEHTTSAVSVIHHGGELMALGEFGYPYLLDADDLSTKGVFNYDGKLTGNMTAHPRIDPETGELIFFGYNVMAPYLTYMRADAAGNMLQVEPITMSGPSMIHDFAVTKNYVVFMDMPVRFSWFSAVAGSGLPFKWDDGHVTRFGVMPRTGTDADVKWFDIPSCFIFHIMNSFEQGDEVVFDAARYDALWVKDSNDFFHPARLTRFSMNMKTGKASVNQIYEKAMEFPQVNRQKWTQPYRYGYSLAVDEVNDTPDLIEQSEGGIRKYDLQTGEVDAYMPGVEYTPGEAIFIPAQESGGGEDEGYLVSFIYDKNTRTSDFCILDATNVSAGPIAKVKLPVRVPVGFHGVWVPDSAMS